MIAVLKIPYVTTYWMLIVALLIGATGVIFFG